jgi:hypothetical protein
MQGVKVEPEDRLELPQAVRQPVDHIIYTLCLWQIENCPPSFRQCLVYFQNDRLIFGGCRPVSVARANPEDVPSAQVPTSFSVVPKLVRDSLHCHFKEAKEEDRVRNT